MADKFPINYLISFRAYKKIILTGAAFGGALATHVYLKHLKESVEAKYSKEYVNV